MIPSIGITEMIVIGIVAVLLFGSKLPQVARNVGRSYGELRRGLTELKSSIDAEIDEAESTPAATPGVTDRSNVVADDYTEPTAPRLNPPANDA